VPAGTPSADGNWYWNGGSWVPAFNRPAGVQPVYAVQPKSPALALILSFFIPGVGTLVNGETGKGIGILLGWLVSAFLTVFCLVGLVAAIPLWIWGMVDAYTGAQNWNRERGIIS
jgi:TM2 domain-containing membrane protein YozV